MTTTSVHKASVDGLKITCNKGIHEYHPFFLTKVLEGRHSFEVELISTDNNSYDYIGIAASTLRNTVNTYSHADSLVLAVAPSYTHLYS